MVRVRPRLAPWTTIAVESATGPLNGKMLEMTGGAW